MDVGGWASPHPCAAAVPAEALCWGTSTRGGAGSGRTPHATTAGAGMSTATVWGESPAAAGTDVCIGWAALLGEHRDNLVRIADLRLRHDVSGSDAEDVVHEVFLRVVCRGPDPHEVSRPAAYLKQAVVNECMTRWRRHRELAVDEAPDRHVGDHADRCVTALAVRAALALLTPRQRSVIVLGFLHGYSDAEVAEILGIKPVTVRTLRARGLRRMRDILVAEPTPTPAHRPAFARRITLPTVPQSHHASGQVPDILPASTASRSITVPRPRSPADQVWSTKDVSDRDCVTAAALGPVPGTPAASSSWMSGLGEGWGRHRGLHRVPARRIHPLP